MCVSIGSRCWRHGRNGGGMGWDVQSGILAAEKSRNSSHCTRSHATELPAACSHGWSQKAAWFLVSSRAEHCPPAFLLSAPTPALQDPCWTLGVLGLTPDLTMVGSMGRGSRAVRPCLGGGGGLAWSGRLCIPPMR